MALLCNRPPILEASFSVKDDHACDTVLVGKALWGLLSASDASLDRRALSIAPARLRRTNVREIQALTCWGVLNHETTELSIPPKWLTIYHHIFCQSQLSSSKPLTVTEVLPVVLTEVIVTALSNDAYATARSHESQLESLLSKDCPILRQGAVHSFNPSTNGHLSNQKSLRYRLDMVGPVLQGFARQGETKFIITSATPSYIDNSDRDSLQSNFKEDQEGIEIDESFLASTVLPSVMTPPFIPRDGTLSTNGHATVNSISEHFYCPPSNFTFRVDLLKEPMSLVDDYTIYLRTAELGRVGALNGDWAVAGSNDASTHRLVRVVANDNLLIDSGVVSCSPLLLYNILPDSSRLEQTLSVHFSLHGSGSLAIPLVRTLSVARIASPSSNDKTYQHLLLRALKAYFKGAKRLVKRGDMIAVGIDTDALRGLQENESASDDAFGSDEVTFDHLYPDIPDRTNEIVFFVVADLKYDISPTDVNSQKTYLGPKVGKLGCWVDPELTRMVQVGVEHSLVPDVVEYLGIDRCTPSKLFATPNNSSNLLGHDSPFRKVLALTSATLVHQAKDYNLHGSILLNGARGTGKFTVARWIAQRLGMHILEVNCYDLIGENDVKTEGTLRARFEKAASCSPCILILRHIDALGQTTQVLETGKEPIVVSVIKECTEDLEKAWGTTGFPIVLFGTTSEPARVPTGVRSCFKHEVDFDAPNESERYEILSSLLLDSCLAPDVSLSTLATQTAALVAVDLVDLVTRAKLVSKGRATRGTQAELVHAGVVLTAADFDIALSKARVSYSESIGAPKIPNVSWDDVGGLAHVKSDILDTIQLPLDHPELFADGLKKRSGILLYGPPGTGKTLLAKAVATSCSLNFFSVKGPELLNMYIGESEANVRRVFQRARDAKPCVIFFDELDSVAPKRGNHGDSGGIMDRIVSQLLAELDGMSAGKGGADVFVIGATNRPDLLDPALLRPGRFDRMLYLGVSETHQAQLTILQALTRKFRLHPDLDLERFAGRCPFTYTGADFYALCSDAMLNAMSRKAAELEAKIANLNNLPYPYEHPHLTPQYYLSEFASPEDIEVFVSQRDFEVALSSLVPSVSQLEMEHYTKIQRRFSREAVLSKYLPTSMPAMNGQSQASSIETPLSSRKHKGKAVEARVSSVVNSTLRTTSA